MKALTILKSFAVVILTMVSIHASADVDTFADANGVTLSGHDAVAYFTENAAVEGSAEFTSVHDGAQAHQTEILLTLIQPSTLLNTAVSVLMVPHWVKSSTLMVKLSKWQTVSSTSIKTLMCTKFGKKIK